MENFNNIVKLAVDNYHGNVQKYSAQESNEVLRQALVDLNGGSTTMNYRDIRDGKCAGLFTLIEQILSRTVVEGLQGDEFFMNFVDFRNVAEGDKNIFLTEDNNLLFVVSEAADGTQGIRRQRLSGISEVSIPTSLKVVKIYEELNRVLAGRVDFNHFINVVAESFQKHLLDEIYALWTTATADDFGGNTYFPVAGAYDEDALLDLIAHVEAAGNGQPATIIGTKKAIRKLLPSIVADEYKSDMYNWGVAGKFYGTPVMTVPQRHKIGSTDFVMRDDILTIVSGSDKPIKCVYEGDPLVITGDPLTKGDLTFEYLFAEKYGLAIMLTNGNAGIGRYEMT